MNILHQKLDIVIWQLLPGLLPLVDRVAYNCLGHKYQIHWLLQWAEALGLTMLEQGCAAHRQGSGQGSRVIHPVLRRGGPFIFPHG